MSISFGSTGIKPYVGSKEVQEAYVGSQLVYRASLPSNYMFLGTENDYYKSDNVQLVKQADIAKLPVSFTPQTFKLCIATKKSMNQWFGGEVRINNAGQFVGQKLKFTAYSANGSATLRVANMDKFGYTVGYRKTFTISKTQDALFEIDVVNGVLYISFESGDEGPDTIALDAIRFEPV